MERERTFTVGTSSRIDESNETLLLKKLQTNYSYGIIGAEQDLNNTAEVKLTADGRNAINMEKLTSEELIEHLGIACWNWALSGGTLKASDPNSPISLYMEVIQTNLDEFDKIEEITINMPDQRNLELIFSNNVESGIQAIKDLHQFVQVHGSRLITNVKKLEFMRLGMKIAALANGLIPNNQGEGSKFTLHMDTEDYNYSTWTHWGIGVLRSDGTRSIIQTLPGSIQQTRPDSSGNKPEWLRLRENTQQMWAGPGYLTAVIGIDNLLPAHYNLLLKDHYEAMKNL